MAKYAAGGASLKPTVFKQNEVGFALKLGWMQLDLARYTITSSNEVRTVSPGVYENFGRARRTGTEGSLRLTPLDDLELTVIGNTAHARVLENANPALVGQQVTGVPHKSVAATVAWRPQVGLGANLEWRRVSNSAVNATNTLFYGAFQTVDLGAQYAGMADGQRWRAYAKVENAADRRYASNAFVIGGQTLVAPAPPRGLQLGVQADF